MPLGRRGVTHPSGDSLGLDLHALFAHRPPRLSRDVHLRRAHLQALHHPV